MFGTNCFVVAPGPGEECVVVDPGAGIDAPLDEVLREHRLRPVAVLLTHGHLDHTFSVTPVCDAHQVPAYVHPDDRYRLVDPLTEAGGQMRALLASISGRLTWTEPDDVRPLVDGAPLTVAGLELFVDHVPGHTEGSVQFRAARSDDTPPLALTGDLLFAGSIGRMDLPGGDPGAMIRSLRDKILPLDDETVVLPGHGPATTVGEERLTNPYLLEVAGHTPASGAFR
jgi:glyoxylase-like metal-dependent hydrolase (beta-lactamase superfamily II)